MASALRISLRRKAPACLLIIVCVGTGITFLASIRRVALAPGGDSGARRNSALAWSGVADGPVSNMAWKVLRARPELGAGRGLTAGALQQRYRLAGTFAVQGENGVERRQAVVDDTRTKEQKLLHEGETWGDIQVESIQSDRIVIRAGNHREEIRLSMMYTGGSGGGTGVVSGNVGADAQAATGTPVRFGAQIASNRWAFKRDALMGYYQEMLDDPDRMAQVFDSLKPIYDDRQKIGGYVLGIEGEADFFRDVGLQEGDVVRKVNSIPMSGRRRAEYFIKEFAAGHMNVFVLEVERDGQMQKLVYQVR